MFTIFHNSRCGKSRECLAFLRQSHDDITVVNYFVNPPTFKELDSIIKMLKIKSIELVRRKEAIWIAEYKSKPLTDQQIIEAMVTHPILIERPIVIRGNKAVIARPLENLDTLL